MLKSKEKVKVKRKRPGEQGGKCVKNISAFCIDNDNNLWRKRTIIDGDKFIFKHNI